MPVVYPRPLSELINQLKRLPGIGPRSAERLGLWLIKHPGNLPEEVVTAIAHARTRVVTCESCGFYLELDQPCTLCTDPRRDAHLRCVVEHASDILPIERADAFQGLYWVLGGRLSPLDHVRPEDLRIESLIELVNRGDVTEIILALSSDVEGETTAHYLASKIQATGVKVTRLAQGLPAGHRLEGADEITLRRAMQGRLPLSGH